MAANGISTLPNKTDRKMAKIALAAAKRGQDGTIGYRMYNFYIGSVSPTIGRPWALTYSGGLASTGIIGGLASTVTFADPPMDGGANNAAGTFTATIDGGAAVFV